MEGTAESLLQDLITGKYGNPYLVRIGILIMSGIGSNISSVNAEASKVIFSICDIIDTWKATASLSPSE